MDIIQIARYLDQLLDIENIKDSPRAVNGLQVQNTGAIRKVGLAVATCQATIGMAIERDCQMMFVHHGIFWGSNEPITGNIVRFNHVPGGCNGLYMDGHVEFVRLNDKMPVRAEFPGVYLGEVESWSGVPPWVTIFVALWLLLSRVTDHSMVPVKQSVA